MVKGLAEDCKDKIVLPQVQPHRLSYRQLVMVQEID